MPKLIDLLFRTSIMVLILYVLLFCPSDYLLSSPVCKSLHTYRIAILKPLAQVLRRTCIQYLHHARGLVQEEEDEAQDQDQDQDQDQGSRGLSRIHRDDVMYAMRQLPVWALGSATETAAV
ncbi:hypothetical protein BV20DRAFT_1052458 [Pilatotrama ljubarskyi]|nr:hypothetical protein BV20DRAFT_1052458 [Pilatotrama ljubarskyi]